jgi:predicted RNA-binding protein with RPS1 domain
MVMSKEYVEYYLLRYGGSQDAIELRQTGIDDEYIADIHEELIRRQEIDMKVVKVTTASGHSLTITHYLRTAHGTTRMETLRAKLQLEGA